jgi:hypothetical protein
MQFAVLVKHRPQHLLQRRGVVRQGVRVDLHSSMMDDGAASQPVLSGKIQRFSPRIPACGPAAAPAIRIHPAALPAAAP